MPSHTAEKPSLEHREQFATLPLASLTLPSSDVRQSRDADYVARLATDVKRRGIKHPIRVRATGDAYEILTGAYRYLAAQVAGLAEVPCIIVSEELTETDVLVEQTLENEHRKNMSDVERGEAYLRELGRDRFSDNESGKFSENEDQAADRHPQLDA